METPISLAIPKVAADVIWRTVDEEILFLNTSTGEYFTLNSTGAQIWAMLMEGSSVGDVAAFLAETYGLSETQAQQDIAELLSELETGKILDRCAS